MKKFKDWRKVRLINNRRQQARIKRLQSQDFLVFPEHVKMRFVAELATLKAEESEILKEMSNNQ